MDVYIYLCPATLRFTSSLHRPRASQEEEKKSHIQNRTGLPDASFPPTFPSPLLLPARISLLPSLPCSCPTFARLPFRSPQAPSPFFDLSLPPPGPVSPAPSPFSDLPPAPARSRLPLDLIEEVNSRLSMRLDAFESASSSELLLSMGLFDSMLQDACRATHGFTKLLVDLMKDAGWDLGLATNSVYPDIEYAKRGHKRYAFLSYVCLAMFEGFDSATFGLCGNEFAGDLNIQRKKFLKEFVEHGSIDAMELLSRNPDCNFARF
ncbi:hypothetical protein ACLOJK_029728 [Asimina triloba]